MNYRIVPTPSEYPDVLLYRNIAKSTEPQTVIIHAIGKQKGIKGECAAWMIVQRKSPRKAQIFIRDYTIERAIQFCEEHNLTY